ncbi:MAG TPA: zinc finger domain-containing protein [Candidatus Nitrosocosmicus sp.]
MSKQFQIPICNSCERPIIPKEESVKFYCPNCSHVLIWRCQNCREFARQYECNRCNFKGI